MGARLRAGVLGLGMMGRHHARVLAGLDEVDLVAVADPAGDVHRSAGGVEVVDSLAGLIARRIDYCVVAVPTLHHQQVALELADAGVHALIEKPLASSVQAAKTVADAFADAGLLGAVGHVERYNSALQSLRSRIDAGDLGRIHQVATRRQGPYPARIQDVGVVKDLASHDIDLTSWITRRPYRTVSAVRTAASGRQHEDFVSITAMLSGDVIASHLVNWMSPLKDRCTVVTGERGMFIADTLHSDLTFYSNAAVAVEWSELAQFRGVAEGDVTRYALTKGEPLVGEHRAFRDVLLGREADLVTLADGLAVLTVCEAALTSADQQRTVQIDVPSPIEEVPA